MKRKENSIDNLMSLQMLGTRSCETLDEFLAKGQPVALILSVE